MLNENAVNLLKLTNGFYEVIYSVNST